MKIHVPLSTSDGVASAELIIETRGIVGTGVSGVDRAIVLLVG